MTPPLSPARTDYVGYETLIEFIKANDILSVEGDLVDIGAFLGGGTRKLSEFLVTEKSIKKVYAIDVFNPALDKIEDTEGIAMATYYQNILKDHNNRSQWEIFSQTIKGCKNIVVIKSDTKNIHLSLLPASLCFGFIDGNHAPSYVENDFYLVWNILSSGGAVAFHDYEHKLPQTTAKIQQLVSKHASEIDKTYHDKKKHILFIIIKYMSNSK